MALLQREVLLGQHPLGCPACQKEPCSLGPVGAKQRQGPITTGLCARLPDGHRSSWEFLLKQLFSFSTDA